MGSATQPLDRTAWLGLALIAALGAAGAGAQAPAAEDEGGIKVTVVLYSGRPDPTYTVDAQELIDRIKAAVAEAKPAEGDDRPVIPSILGYRGIRIDNRGGVAGFAGSIAVYKGRIEVVEGRQRRVLVDEGGRLERLLLDEAIRRDVIEKTILERMQKER